MDAAPPSPEGTGDQPAEEQGRTEAQVEAARSAKLTRLRIAGFKSFAEPTLVEVMPGLTGIVGPNGCGKSNIVEALRWAMGETNARTMRGGEMDDVIFAGTSSRASRNVAEVTLTLEEAAGLAPPPNADTAELEISRKIERGAGSAFRVNGRELRARDVQTMFADIGSGARSSAMVSQGRVAALIQAKPEDRRAVLEEAAARQQRPLVPAYLLVFLRCDPGQDPRRRRDPQQGDPYCLGPNGGRGHQGRPRVMTGTE